MPTPGRHALALLLLLLIAASAAAQPNDRRDRSGDDDDDDDDGRRMSPGARSRRQQPPPSFSAPMVVLLVALIAVFVFIGLFSIYIRQCGGRGGASSSGPAIPAAALLALSRQEEQHNQQRDGLDPALVASFPTMTYAEARALRVPDDDAMAVLECAVCLSEFEGDEELRLLPKCSHAFHPDCIGDWLAGHATCPVCRRSLKPDDHKEDSPAPRAAAAEANGSAEQQQDQVGIDVNGEEEEERRRELDRIGSQQRAMRSRSGRSISRAHSTGHSLSLSARRPREPDLERFTLRLPEQLRREMEAESLRRAVARDYDGSSSSSRPAARSARIGWSDRWQQQQSFIARTFSSSRVPFWGAAASRRAPDAEAIAGAGAPAGSTTTTTPAVTTTTGQGRAVREKTADGSVGSAKAGSLRFDCLGGGGAVAAADDSENEAEEEKAIVRRA